MPQLFDGMKEEGVVPDTVTYNSLITACAQGQALGRALSLHAEMQVSFVG